MAYLACDMIVGAATFAETNKKQIFIGNCPKDFEQLYEKKSLREIMLQKSKEIYICGRARNFEQLFRLRKHMRRLLSKKKK